MKTLTPKQKLALVSLLSGDSINTAAVKSGVSESTVDNWLKLPEFKTVLRDESDRIYQQSLSQVLRLLKQSISVLSDILSDGCDKDKLTAIKLIFDNSHKWHDRDLEQRLEVIEQILLDEKS